MEKKVLLISNKVFHYRVPIYNYLAREFAKEGIQFFLLTNEVQSESPYAIQFDYEVLEYSFFDYKKHVENIQPDVVIFFMNLKDWVMWPLSYYLGFKNIPFIKWGHGVNLEDPDNPLKKLFFNNIHNRCSAILIYSPNEKKFFSKKNQHKISVANNTLNFEVLSEIKESGEQLKSKFGIPFKKVVLFVGRIQKRKKLDYLINIFRNKQKQDCGLVIVGPGIEPEQQQIVEESENIIYLGPLYKENEINSLFKLSDVFSIPGANGLGLNQALYWGLPVVTMEGWHGPEVYYLKDGYNGFLTKPTVQDLEEKIFYLLKNEEVLASFSENARKTMAEEGHIKSMFLGFKKAVEYALSNNR